MSRRTEAAVVIDCGAMAQLTATERHKVNILLRRMRHLQIRFDLPDKVRSWDLAEYAALHWALERIGVVLTERKITPPHCCGTDCSFGGGARIYHTPTAGCRCQCEDCRQSKRNSGQNELTGLKVEATGE